MAYPLNNYYHHMHNLLQTVIFSIKIVIQKLGIWCNVLLLICQVGFSQRLRLQLIDKTVVEYTCIL